ncbi:MAG TPA: hypothetical protein VHP11_12930 [Tepidisphaeraceae bacterium]|nr:hypothetical protein [Tepidisphaeraceae bacterium]
MISAIRALIRPDHPLLEALYDVDLSARRWNDANLDHFVMVTHEGFVTMPQGTEAHVFRIARPAAFMIDVQIEQDGERYRVADVAGDESAALAYVQHVAEHGVILVALR